MTAENSLRPIALIATLALGAVISGCAPILETARPQSRIYVYGSDGQPLPGTPVVVMTSFLAPNDLVWNLSTDGDGVATIPDLNSIGSAAPSGGGRQTPLWMWCVERTGHVPVAGWQAGEREMENVHVKLSKGYTSVRCNPSERFADIGYWQERLENGRRGGNMPERRTLPATTERRGTAEASAAPRAFAQREEGRLRLHVITLAIQSGGLREVEVSVADKAAEHVLVLLSSQPVRWKLSIAEGTVVGEVLFYSYNKRSDNSVITGSPEGVVPIDIRLPMPVLRFGYDGPTGKIQLNEDYVRLQERLRARYGVDIGTFQSGVSQASFMIR